VLLLVGSAKLDTLDVVEILEVSETKRSRNARRGSGAHWQELRRLNGNEQLLALILHEAELRRDAK
jgi:hypothetical protein